MYVNIAYYVLCRAHTSTIYSVLMFTYMLNGKSGFKDTKPFSKAKAKVATFTIESPHGFFPL